MLQKAVDDFKDRIIPLFGKAQSQFKEIDVPEQELRKRDREKGILEVEKANLKPSETRVNLSKKRGCGM